MNESAAKVAFVTRFVPSYRWPILEALHQRLDGNLIVAAGDPPGSSSLNLLRSEGKGSGGKDIESIPLRNRWLHGEALHWQSFGALFNGKHRLDALLIEESPRSISLRPLLKAARKRGIPTILWGHFSSINRGFSTDSWKDRRRIETASLADAAVVYTDELADYLRPLLEGTPVFPARNTLDTNTLFPLGDALMQEGRTAVRHRLGLKDQPTLLFLGRLIQEKGALRLVDIAQLISERRKERVSVVVVGDGPERSALEEAAKRADIDLHCKGALTDLSESAPWIAACDALVNPGYLGLSVNHAFSMGVPVVAPMPSANGAGHSPEWAFLRSGYNGFLTPSGSTDDLASATITILNDPMLFSRQAATFARKHLSLEKMVDGLCDALAHVAPSIGLTR